MLTRSFAIFALAAAASALAVPAQAQNAAFVLSFGGEPGTPLAHAYDYGGSPEGVTSFALRVPIVDPTIKTVFVDSELVVDAATRMVKQVHIERAMGTVALCTEAQAVVAKKLAELMPTPYTGTSPLWQYTAGGVVGGVSCRQERYLPFPILILDLSLAPQ